MIFAGGMQQPRPNQPAGGRASPSTGAPSNQQPQRPNYNQGSMFRDTGSKKGKYKHVL